MENGIDPKSLQDYVATANSGKYKSWDEINSKFPEFKSVDKKLLQDYVATANSGKYKGWEEINSKFPEFKIGEQVKKKELTLPSTDFSASSQFLQEKPTSTPIPFKQGVEVEKPKVKVNRENVIKRADAGEINPDIKELSKLLEQPLAYQQENLPDFNLNKPLPKIDKRDIDDFVVNSRVVRDLREKSIQQSGLLENGINKIEQQAQNLIQQYEQAPTPELKSQMEQLDKDYQLTLKEYNKQKFFQDVYEKRLLQISDSIKQLANDKVPDNFFIGFFQRLKDNPAEFDEYVDLFQKSKAEQIQFAKDAYLKMPTKEVEWYSPGGAGQIAGDLTVDGLIAVGASLAGTPALGIGTIAAKFGAMQAGEDFVRTFNKAKTEGIATGQYDKNGRPILREATDDEAYDIATKAAGVGFGTGTIEGLALGLTGGAYSAASRTAGKILPKAAAKVVGVGAAGAQEAVISGTMKTGRNVFDQYQGLQTKTLEGVPETMISRAALGSVMAIPKTFKDIKYSEQEPYFSEYVDLGSVKTSEKAKAQLFESVFNAKDNPAELKKLSENLEVVKNQGLVTESEYKDIVKTAQQYQEILPTIPEEIKNKKAAADLIIERNDLSEKAQTVDEAYKKPIEERIKQINEELLKVDEKPITPTPTAEVTLPEVEVTAEKPAPTEPIEAKPVPTTEDLKPTIVVNGNEYSGANHGEAMDNAIAAGEDVPDWRTPEGETWREENGMFKDKEGKLLTRDETEQQYGIRRSEELKPTEEVAVAEPLKDLELGGGIKNKVTNDGTKILPIDEINNLRSQAETDLATGNAISLEKDLTKNGIKEPLVITYYPNEGKAVLTDGHNRLDVAKDMGAEKLPIRIVEKYTEAPKNAKDWTPPKEEVITEAKPTEVTTEEITPTEQITFDMVTDEKTNKPKYKNKAQAMTDYRKNRLADINETFEEFLYRIIC